MRIKSNTRVNPAEKVEAKVVKPRTFKPVADAMSCCSAMNISK